ncbi:MAG: electron transport complex protein RnfG [Gammaproteobacteria bacterium]|jgi:electron transport complex protein RnfG
MSVNNKHNQRANELKTARKEMLQALMGSSGKLIGFAFLGSALLAITHFLTADRIAENERQAVLRGIEEVVEPSRYDNSPSDDIQLLSPSSQLDGENPVLVYRARKSGKPVAAIVKSAALNGYNGRIGLLVGINYDGSISGVRIVRHKETPGLGDTIETRKSDWVLSFNNRTLGDTDWAVKKDGGDFDQFTGATITPRAIVQNVKATLQYFNDNREAIFAQGASRP